MTEYKLETPTEQVISYLQSATANFDKLAELVKNDSEAARNANEIQLNYALSSMKK